MSMSQFRPLCPKPHTPFQWEAQISTEETRRKQSLLREGLYKKKLRYKYHDAELSFLEGVFARGDRRLSAVLKRAVELGCRFDGWREHFDFSRWQQAFSDCGIEPAWYLRQRGEEEILPWDHIDCGVPKSFYLRERNKAFAEAATLDCRGGCHGCGVCDFEQLKMQLVESCEFSARDAVPAGENSVVAQEQLTRVRLTLRKAGRARLVGHLEYLTMFQRAIRRAGLPIRYTQGFHPTPKVSYLEALPMGVASEAELVDLELHYPVPLEELTDQLNAQLPDGFKVIDAALIAWKAPSPSASVASSSYTVPLPETVPADLELRIASFLAAESVPTIRLKKGREEQIDLRPDLVSLTLTDGMLHIELTKSSPLQVAAYLFDLDVEDVRRLGVSKTAIQLKY